MTQHWKVPTKKSLFKESLWYEHLHVTANCNTVDNTTKKSPDSLHTHKLELGFLSHKLAIGVGSRGGKMRGRKEEEFTLR